MRELSVLMSFTKWKNLDLLVIVEFLVKDEFAVVKEAV